VEAEVPFTAFSPVPQGCQSSQPGLPAADLPVRRVLASAALALAPAEPPAESLADQPSLSPSIPAAELSNRARRARALLGLAIGLAFLALATALGLLFSSAVYGYPSGGLA
jgi:hypothetical protein